MGYEKISAILVLAGNATRMGLQENKVFLPLGLKKIFEYSLDLFLKYNFEVICVVKPEEESYLAEYLYKIKIAYGGKTRQESVYNGLKLASCEYVIIHDGARPFIDEKIIQDCLQAIKEEKNFIVVGKCKDTPYQRKPLKALNRQNLVLAQTPQGGKKQDFLLAHEKAIKDNLAVTDDISLLLMLGNDSIKLLEGSETNFKITTQIDYILAKELIKNA